MQLSDCQLLVTLPELVAVTPVDATLGGSIPLRAARACTPFLAGNALGVRLSLTSKVTLRRGLGRTTLTVADEVAARHRALVPLFVRAGLLTPADARRFADGPCVVERGRATLFTGVFIEPPPGEFARLGHAGNRRAVTVDVEERLFGAGEGAAPIVLTLSLARGLDAATLIGELASLTRLTFATLEEADERLVADVIARHGAFFDERYFVDKTRGPTKKYAKRARRGAPPSTPGPSVARLARLDAPQLVARSRPVRAARGTIIGETTALELAAALDVEARYDGHHLALTVEPAARDAYAARVSRAYLRHAPSEAHPGARLYLAKYATPHQAGEPNFFVKPPELLETSRGASTALFGALGDGWDVLSAVVETDWFHALPAVVRVHRVDRPVRLARGAPLFTAYPCRREVAAAPFSTSSWDPLA